MHFLSQFDKVPIWTQKANINISRVGLIQRVGANSKGELIRGGQFEDLWYIHILNTRQFRELLDYIFKMLFDKLCHKR